MGLKLLSIMTLCLIVASNVMPQRKADGQKIRRNLATYDKAGPHNFHNELHPRDADKLLGELRDFLWKHWMEQRLGLVTATFYTIEGDSTKSRYFVESDTKGLWNIRVHSESNISALLPKRSKPRREITTNDYDEVDRVEPTSTSIANSVPIPNNEVRQPQKFKLRLRNSRTNSVRIF